MIMSDGLTDLIGDGIVCQLCHVFIDDDRAEGQPRFCGPECEARERRLRERAARTTAKLRDRLPLKD